MLFCELTVLRKSIWGIPQTTVSNSRPRGFKGTRYQFVTDRQEETKPPYTQNKTNISFLKSHRITSPAHKHNLTSSFFIYNPFVGLFVGILSYITLPTDNSKQTRQSTFTMNKSSLQMCSVWTIVTQDCIGTRKTLTQPINKFFCYLLVLYLCSVICSGTTFLYFTCNLQLDYLIDN